MKRVAIQCLLLLTCLLPSHGADSASWKLVWSDEFNQPGQPDPAKWGYEVGFVRNQEAQFYTLNRKENARVEGGNLIIEARKEQFTPAMAPDTDKGVWRRKGSADYTSASLTTKGKVDWTNGRIEVKAKLPAGRGTWPAIWMLGTNINQAGWPTCGEIDIMEFVGYQPGVIHANVHMAKYNHAKGTGKGSTIKQADVTSEFHVYGLEWHPDRLDFFLDEQKYFTFKNEHPGSPVGAHTDVWPFDKAQYLILNLAIGGAWGGQKGIDDSIFPTRYYIDYVRVYQSKAGR
jgi:beta-glucanase (GH16 family)